MIKIPHNKAIQLLQARLNDIDKPETDLDALTSKIHDDVVGIFGKGSNQHINSIKLPTLHFNDPKKIEEFKTNIRQKIQGWIDYIQDFHIIAREEKEISEQEYKQKYENLLVKWNDLVPEYNQLLTN